jgi:hypothetical protein
MIELEFPKDLIVKKCQEIEKLSKDILREDAVQDWKRRHKVTLLKVLWSWVTLNGGLATVPPVEESYVKKHTKRNKRYLEQRLLAARLLVYCSYESSPA